MNNNRIDVRVAFPHQIAAAQFKRKETGLMAYSEQDVEQCLRNLGVRGGDAIFVHAAMKGLGEFDTPGDNAFDTLLRIFQRVVGLSGTIVVPTFNFGFCKGHPFDVQNTEGQGMGQFSEYIRKHDGALRSAHPFQSVAAIGKQADRVTRGMSRTAFSDGGAFAEMLGIGTKIVFFGVPFVETFVHVAEERAKVDYRFWKTFEGDVIDKGRREHRKVDFYARMLDLLPEPRIDNEKLLAYFTNNGILTRSRLGDGNVGVAIANHLVDDLTAVLKRDPRFALRA